MNVFSSPRTVPCLMLCVVLVAACPAAAVSVAINELLASNTRVSADPQGHFDDWIELYNPGQSALDVGGMYLTDDPTEPRKWQIPTTNPALTTIAAKGHLVIWADGDTQDTGLHANFKLSADGDEVALFDTDGSTLIDHLTFDRQTPNVSYGRYPDGGQDLVVMVFPTPRSGNIYFSVGVVAEPKFSRNRGFYDAPFTLELTTETEGAAIYYTLDGRDPLDDSGRFLAGTPYTGPIEITGTTCVRAAALKDDWVPSSVVTASYIFLEDVIHQPVRPSGFPNTWGSTVVDYQMDPEVVNDPAYAPTIKDDLLSVPSVSVVLSNDDFFGSQRGIYANLQAGGINWERAASVEWIDPIAGEDFQVNCGLRVHGSQYGRSASVGKHSLRMLFKNEYGPSKLRFPLFPDTEVETFESLVLRGIWNYSWFGDSTACGGLGTASADYLRDQFSRDTIRDLGGLTPYSRGVHAYVNGLYWGMYIFVERPDDGFLAEHLGGDKEDYDVLYANSTMEVKTGDLAAWNKLFSLAAGDLSSTEAYEAIQEYVDIEAMIDYMLMIYYVGSRDAPVLLCNNQVPRNFYAVRRREPGGPFLFVAWDVEWTLESPYENRVRVVGQQNPHYLVDRLKANADFRILLADLIYKRFYNDGVLTPGPCIDRYMDRVNEVHGAIVGESARWGDSRRSRPYTRDVEWMREVDRLVNSYFSVRTDVVLDQLRQAGFYPSLNPPDFYVNNQFQHGGQVATGAALTLSAGTGTIWYTLDGSDPRVWGTAIAPGAQITLAPESAAKRVLVPTAPVDDAWRGGQAFDDSGWTGGTGGVGYENSTGYEQFFNIDVRNQMYGRNPTCYVRVPFTVAAADLPELSYLALKARYDDGFIAYLNGAEVARVAFNGDPSWNSSASANHSDIDAIEFETFNLSAYVDQLRPGQNILALQALNESNFSSDLLLSVELLATKGPAPGAPTGVSVTALQYTGPVTLGASTQVKARVLSGSTWSALNEATFAVGPVAESLRLSEIMYHPIDTGQPDDPNAEFIELTNVGAETINLNLVRFTNGVDFTFPNVDLAPGDYVVVVCDLAAFQARYGTDVTIAGRYEGRLSNAGERLALQDAMGEVIHDFRFRDDWYDLTDGLGYSLTVRDPAGTDPKEYDDPNTWRAGAEAGGSPGHDDTMP